MSRISEKDKKLGHRRIDEEGEITYKKIATQQIMGSIQLGIQYAIGGLASKPERDLLVHDFMTVEEKVFTSDGANHTPAHSFPKFSFKIYAPIAFRYFRDLFGIQPEDFMLSFCAAPLRELSNPGASGSIFYVTSDDEFIMKTVTHKEAEFLQKLLPGYYMNIVQNPRTLLPKFFGLYCYHCNAKNIRLVVMNNLFPSWMDLHEKFDLKGSTYKRKASNSERQKSLPTFKDLDFMELHQEGLILDSDTYSALMKTMQRDCRVLESFKIMDYSLLVGIHVANKNRKENNISFTPGDQASTSSAITSEPARPELSKNRKRLLFHSTMMESIDAQPSSSSQLKTSNSGGIPAKNSKGETIILFIGIIDILQSYKMMKKLEHTLKSVFQDGDAISVHRPDFYANRFLNFMSNTVFRKSPIVGFADMQIPPALLKNKVFQQDNHLSKTKEDRTVSAYKQTEKNYSVTKKSDYLLKKSVLQDRYVVSGQISDFCADILVKQMFSSVIVRSSSLNSHPVVINSPTSQKSENDTKITTKL